MDQEILRLINKYHLFQQNDRVLIGVSGGPDSMALLHWLHKHKESWGLYLIAVHLNHQLRGKDADEDESYVQRVCQDWQIPCVTKRVNVKEFAQKHNLSKQVAARRCRYQLFYAVAKEYSLTKAALAHHADDQIETVLMRLVRGTGLQGMSGIPVERRTDAYKLVRPFLTVSKAQIEQYCTEHMIHPRIDMSNESDDYTRNWMRHHVVPLLATQNPQLHQAVYHMTETLYEDNKYLEQEAKKALNQVMESKDVNKISIGLTLFKDLALSLQRRVILLILNYITNQQDAWNKIHIDQVLELTQKETGQKQLFFPFEVNIIKEYGRLHFQRKAARTTHVQQQKSYEYLLSAEGEYHFHQPSIKISIEKAPCVQEAFETPSLKQGYVSEVSSITASFDLEELSLPLVLRNRRSGDRIQPLGMNGQQKVKNIFIDNKIPIGKRQRWPIIADQKGILWLPFLKRADRAKITRETKQMWSITVEILEEVPIRAR